MRVALFVTCLVDAWAPDVGRAVIRILERLGMGVDVPLGQSCCGQMHVNSGYPGPALPLIRRCARVFEGYDAVVVPSGSCAAAVRHQHAALAEAAGDRALAQQAGELASRTYELSEFLVDMVGVVDVGAYFPHRVTYHPACHSMRLLRLGDRPMRLLRAVDGIDLAELPDAAECCGFGGTFAVKNAAVSAAMLADKATAVRTTGAAYCAAADVSCLLHIGGGLSRLGCGVQARHIAEILASTR